MAAGLSREGNKKLSAGANREVDAAAIEGEAAIEGVVGIATPSPIAI